MAQRHLKWIGFGLLLLLMMSLISITNGLDDIPRQSNRRILQQQQEEQVGRSEWYGLFSLRSSLGLRSKEWPKKVNPCTTWKGIQCSQGHIVSIDISGFRRTVVGARDPQFSVDGFKNMTFLQAFNASGFALPGSIPDWFGNLSSLRVLDLSFASITGLLPSSLGSLGNMTELVLSHNNITGSIPVAFGELTNLKTLNLSFNNLSGAIPSSLSNLRSLDILDLSSNRLEGMIFPSIGNLSSLKQLNLARNLISGAIPNQLSDLSMLSDLDLGSNNFSGAIPRDLDNLKKLTSLMLAENSFDGSIPAGISKCTELQRLVLDDNNLNGELPESIGLLTQLQTLNVSSNNLTGHLPRSFSNLLSIKDVDLSNNQFFSTLPALSALSKLAAFDISSNYFEGKIPGGLTPSAVTSQRNCLQGVMRQRSNGDCEAFYKSKGLHFLGLGQIASPPESPFDEPGKDSNHLAAILGGVFGGLGLVLIVILIIYLFLKQERKVATTERDLRSSSAQRGNSPGVGISVNLSRLGDAFGYDQLLRATGDFSPSNLIKNGHSGDLYHGLLDGGIPIVVKRIDLKTHRREGYLSELDTLGKASHTRLVPFLGHCLEHEEDKLLVYKYMPYRDLSNSLYKKVSIPDDTLQSLDWITRLKIAIGAAEALAFLHHECTPPIVHRDVQASSILLDDKYEVRLGSLSDACIQEGEAHQSVISRLLRRSNTLEQNVAGAPAACSYDVYCFGKVLMELVSGKLGISGSGDSNANQWLEWALPLISIHEKESITKIVDPSLIVIEDLMEEVWAMAIVAKSCLNPKPSKRPLMRYILKALENPLKVVREDTSNSSARLRTSSRGSWNAALFGSWRHSSSEIVAIPGPLREEYTQKNILKQPGTAGSQGSGQAGEISSHKRLSNEIFPEPAEEGIVQASSADVERHDD